MPWGSSLFPLLIITASGKFTGLFVYSPGPAAGNLIASITAASGTDPYGNTYQAGITSYGIAGTFVQLLAASLNLHNSTEVVSGSITESADGRLRLRTGQDVADVPAVIQMSSQVSGGTGAPVVIINAPAAGGPPATAAALEVRGTAALQNATAPAAVTGYAEPFATAGNLAYVNGATGDGNTYDTARRTLYTTGPQTINSTVDAVITGLSIPVAAARYQIEAVIRFTENATDAGNNPVFAFHGPALTDMETEFQEFLVGGAGGVISIVQSGAFGNVTLTAFASHTQVLRISGMVNFSAAGTFSLQAHTTLAADTFTIAQNSRLAVMPVST